MAKCYPPPMDKPIPYNGEMLSVRRHLANGAPVRELRRIWSQRYQKAKRLRRLGVDRDCCTIKL